MKIQINVSASPSILSFSGASMTTLCPVGRQTIIVSCLYIYGTMNTNSNIIHCIMLEVLKQLFSLLGIVELERIDDIIGYSLWVANSFHQVNMFGKEEETHFGLLWKDLTVGSLFSFSHIYCRICNMLDMELTQMSINWWINKEMQHILQG